MSSGRHISFFRAALHVQLLLLLTASAHVGLGTLSWLRLRLGPRPLSFILHGAGKLPADDVTGGQMKGSGMRRRVGDSEGG